MASSRDDRRPAETPDLVRRVADPGFTPSVRLVGALLELVGADDEAVAKNAERAVLRVEAQYAARVAAATVAAAKGATRPARGRLTRLVGRLAQEERDPEGLGLAWLLEALGDEDGKTRRAAVRSLGKLSPGGSDERARTIAAALSRAYDAATNDDDRAALALALGKAGPDDARARLATGSGRAALIAERELARREPGAIDPSRAHDGPLRVWFHTRSGLEDVVKDELGSSFGKARFVAPGIVEATLEGALARALAVRTASHVGFPLPPSDLGDDLADAIVRAITAPGATAILRAFTAARASIRFRLAFARGGHRRAVAWRVAELVRKSSRELVNDPKESTWEVLVDEVGGKLSVELVPRGYVDDRFAYRADLVAASSSPVIAAALARVAPRRDVDVVWDPFVGAGAELIERARLGPYERLIGTDVDPRAIAAARANLARAGVERATLETADACDYATGDVDLIITNPPMGRRVERGRHAALLERFVAHAARVLVPGGALVWIVPEPERMHGRALAAGLALARAFTVDMGGFSAELSVWSKRAKADAGGAMRARPGRARRR